MLVKPEFHVGDRVIVTGIQDNLTEALGREATVVIVYDQHLVMVQFDTRFSDRLHSGSGHDKENRCWQITTNKLERAYPSIVVDDVDALL